MDKELLKYFLPAGILENFEVKGITEFYDGREKCDALKIELEEINQLREPYTASEYESKGFFPERTVQDFPIRGKAVYLLIKRRRWRHKINKNEEVHNDYTFIAKGLNLTQEISDFLKSTGRDPSRYNF